MKSLAVSLLVTSDVAVILDNDALDVAMRGMTLARLWRYGADWEVGPADPQNPLPDRVDVTVVCLFCDPDAERLMRSESQEEVYALLRGLSPILWQFITTTAPKGGPSVAPHGLTLAAVERSDWSYHALAMQAALAMRG